MGEMKMTVTEAAIAAKLKKREENRQKMLEREVCASVARGNISLQQGNYIMREDMDRLQKSLLNYDFVNRRPRNK
jgi:hypothetical protein